MEEEETPHLREVRVHHTHHDVRASSGVVLPDYLDLREALLCILCRRYVLDSYINAILTFRANYKIRRGQYLKFFTGSFGAMLSVGLEETRSTSILKLDKKHGRSLIGGGESGPSKVILIDDIVTTGSSVNMMLETCKDEGLTPLGLIVWKNNKRD